VKQQMSEMELFWSITGLLGLVMSFLLVWWHVDTPGRMAKLGFAPSRLAGDITVYWVPMWAESSAE